MNLQHPLSMILVLSRLFKAYPYTQDTKVASYSPGGGSTAWLQEVEQCETHQLAACFAVFHLVYMDVGEVLERKRQALLYSSYPN